MIEKSESIASLAKALATAQGKFTAAKFDATNPFLKNKYASLGSIIETAKPILAENGLSVSQLMIGAGDHIGVTTVLLHSSGEWIESTVMLPVAEEKGKSAAQAAGSVVTYLRRYALASILGIYADDDTDGQKPTGEKKPEEKATVKATGGNGKQTPAGPALMTYEFACDELDRTGKRYGDLDSDTLAYMATELEKTLKKPNLKEVEIDKAQRKLAAAKTILAHRAEQPE